MELAKKKKGKSKKSPYATVRINKKTLRKCKINKEQTGVSIIAFIDSAVDEKLQRQNNS